MPFGIFGFAEFDIWNFHSNTAYARIKSDLLGLRFWIKLDLGHGSFEVLGSRPHFVQPPLETQFDDLIFFIRGSFLRTRKFSSRKLYVRYVSRLSLGSPSCDH